MQIYEIRPKGDAGRSLPADRMVLVVAACAADASQAFRRALGLPAAPDGIELHDLGPHDGPEEAGSVFVDGYRIAC